MTTSTSSLEQPAEGKSNAIAPALRAELVRRWAATIDAEESWLDARSAAEARGADLVAAAQRRIHEAGMQTYPLPRRISLLGLQAKGDACLRAAERRLVADNRMAVTIAGVPEDITRLLKTCASLVHAAHSAGLAWLSWGHGASPGIGQAWCSEFAEVCAGVHAANLQAHGAVDIAGLQSIDLDRAGRRPLRAQALPAQPVIIVLAVQC